MRITEKNNSISYSNIITKPIVKDLKFFSSTQNNKIMDTPNYPISYYTSNISFNGASGYTRLKVVKDLSKLGELSKNTFFELAENIYGKNLDKVRIKTPKSMSIKISLNDTLETYEQMYHHINDLMGARGIVHSIDDTNIFIFNLLKEIKNGNLNVTQINNFHSNDIAPYLSDKQIQSIKDTCINSGLESPFLRDGCARRNATYDNGYTAAHILGKLKSGAPFELQIKGPKVSIIDELTMITRSIKQSDKKDFVNLINFNTKNGLELKERIENIRDAVHKLDTFESVLINNKYQHDLYKRARLKELGEEMPDVIFPKGLLDSCLHEDYLKQTIGLMDYKF